MRTTLRSLGAPGAALLCVALLVACADGDGAQTVPTTADDTDDDNGGGGGDGGGGNGGGDNGGGVPGAPIDIPSFQQDQGRPLDEVLADIDATVREQCGGEVCIEITVEKTDDGFTECEFVATDPPQGSRIERGGSLLVIAGSEPCEDEGTEEEGTGSEETEGESTGSGETEGEETDGGGTDNEEPDGSTDGGGGAETP